MINHLRRPSLARQARSRRGVAAVEFAVCLPVLVLLVFGSIEASSFIFLKQSLNVAAYECTREAIRSGSTSQSAIDQAENILLARDVQGFDVNILNGEVSGVDRGDEVIVEISAPTETNSPLLGRFLTNRTLTARVVMVKE
ncbi:MAG: pilus assembly protein [Pirellulaceae bacterium]|nr:pilus assembly protein [Pirellulaceae bacterium]